MSVATWSQVLWPGQRPQSFSLARDGLDMAIVLQNLIISASRAKELATGNTVNFMTLKEKRNRPNRTAEKISCLQKVHLYYYFKFLQL